MQASPTAQPTIISGRRGAGGRHKKSPLGAWPSGRGGAGEALVPCCHVVRIAMHRGGDV